MVYRTTLLLLGAVLPERLDLYGEFLRGFVQNYGQGCWHIIYQADVRMRSEQMERIRRQLEIEKASMTPAEQARLGYDPNKPWDGVFARATTRSKDFWDSELKDKCLLYITKVMTKPDTLDDGTTQPDIGGGGIPSGSAPQGKGNKGKQQRRTQTQTGISKGKGKTKSQHSTAAATQGGKNGREACLIWNRGQCAEPCPSGRLHMCCVCGSNHRVADNPACSASLPASGPGKGAGKRK